MATKLVSTTADEVVPRNSMRKSLAIQNEDTTDSVYIKRERGESKTVTTTDHDWKIGPGGSLAFNSLMDGKESVEDRYTAIASANTPRIGFFESEDDSR